MSVYNHRAMVPAMGGRVAELLEGIKSEVDNMTQDLAMYKMHRDDLEHKLTQQLNEMSQMQGTLFELERTHTKIKTQYEEEIHRLRRELEFRGAGAAAGAAPANAAEAAALYGGSSSAPVENYQQSNGSSAKRPRTESATSFSAEEKDGEAQQVLPLSAMASQTNSTGASPAASAAPRATAASAESQESDSVPPSMKKEGSDWHVVWKGQERINIELAHNIDHSSVVCCIKFSADSRFLATGCNHTAQIYDVATGVKVNDFSDSSVKDGTDLYIRSVCFSPDGHYLATGAEDKLIRIWDIKKGKVMMVFSGHEQDIYSLDFSRDGRYICSGSGDKTARIWNMETGKCTFTLCDENCSKDAGVTSVAMSPDGRYVAAGSLDRIVRVWDARTGAFVERFEGHKDSVYSVAFSPDGRSLVSGSLDKTLKLWDLAIGSKGRSQCRQTFTGHRDFVLSVAFSPDGRYVVSGSKDRTVQFWDPNTGASHCTLQGHNNSVISVAMSPDSSSFATGSGDSKARIWRYEVVKS